MIEAVSSSETSVNFYQSTRRNIPEGNNRDEEFTKFGSENLLEDKIDGLDKNGRII
jgi:hypothetical protein